MDSRNVLIPLALLTGAILIANQYRIYKQKSTFEDPDLLKRGLNTPSIWIFVNDTEVNSRMWADFGARSSRVYNLPFLNLCYSSIVKAAGTNYHIEVISGLADAERRLGYLPTPMRNKRLPLRTEEMTYLKVAFLEKFGGLWISPATIFIRTLPELPKDKVVLFGSDPLETYSGPEGTELPNTHVMWSPKAYHPFFTKWKKALEPRIEEQHGGLDIRNDSRWDMVFAGHKNTVTLMPNAELTRKAGGRKLELEDLLASGTEGNLPFEIPNETLYIPLPWPELLERRMYGWFLRLSEDQIKTSDLVVTHLFRLAGV
jgi:hypothetical protein